MYNLKRAQGLLEEGRSDYILSLSLLLSTDKFLILGTTVVLKPVIYMVFLPQRALCH